MLLVFRYRSHPRNRALNEQSEPPPVTRSFSGLNEPRLHCWSLDGVEHRTLVVVCLDRAYLSVITSMRVVNIFQPPNVDYRGYLHNIVNNVCSGWVFGIIINSIIIVKTTI